MVSKQERRHRTVERLLTAAQDLFVSRGFHGTKMEEIGARADMTKGAVYFHFDDKAAVLLALLDRIEAVVLRALIDKVERGGATPLDRVDAFLRHMARLAKESPAMLLLPIIVSIEFAGTNELPVRRVKWGYRRTAQALKKAVFEGQKRGMFRSDLSARRLASMMIALSDGAMLEWLRSDHGRDGKELVATLRAVLFSGMAAGYHGTREVLG